MVSIQSSDLIHLGVKVTFKKSNTNNISPMRLLVSKKYNFFYHNFCFCWIKAEKQLNTEENKSGADDHMDLWIHPIKVVQFHNVRAEHQKRDITKT